MENTILILAYYSFRDPVFQSAVLPYFVKFPTDKKNHFILLTYEQNQYRMTKQEIESTTLFLNEHNISWHRSTWRSGRFKVVKKLIDFMSTVALSWSLIRKYHVRAVYSEGFPGAILGYYVSKLSGVKHIVHTFEPHTDYMIEAGVWKKSFWEAKLMRWHERRIALQSTYIFTATVSMIQRLKGLGVKDDVIYRVPSCVDLDHFQFNQKARVALRKQLQIEDQQRVLVYLGKFGGMYMEDEAFRFFKLCQEQLGAWIMILSTEDKAKLNGLAKKFELSEKSLLIKPLTREEVPAYLSAADMALVAVRQWPSKKYCSPIKTGEYLACGLPVIVPKGVSDDYDQLKQSGIGIIMESFEDISFQLVINEWAKRFMLEDLAVRKASRNYAIQDRSIEEYKNLYAKLFDNL